MSFLLSDENVFAFHTKMPLAFVDILSFYLSWVIDHSICLSTSKAVCNGHMWEKQFAELYILDNILGWQLMYVY